MVETRAELPFIGDQVGLFKPRPARLSIVPVEMSRKEAELPFIGDQVGLSRAQPGRPKRGMTDPVRVETKASAIIRATDILLKRFNDRHRA